MATEKEVAVSDKDIQEVEKQVLEQESKGRADIESRVRKELEAENKAKSLEEQLAAQKLIAEQARAEAEKAKAEADALIKSQTEARIRAEQTARSKAPVFGNSPFGGQSGAEPSVIDAMRKDESLVAQSEIASYHALMNRAKKG